MIDKDLSKLGFLFWVASTAVLFFISIYCFWQAYQLHTDVIRIKNVLLREISIEMQSQSKIDFFAVGFYFLASALLIFTVFCKDDIFSKPVLNSDVLDNEAPQNESDFN